MLLESIPEFLSSLEEEHGRTVLGDPGLHQSIQDSIDAAGCREKRKRRLSACLTLYLVLGLSLYRHLSIPNVLATLLSSLRGLIPGLPYRPASEAAACEARYRLGSAPLKALFKARAAIIAPPASFHGYRVWAIDGVRFSVPDTEENERAFGRPKAGRGKTAYPVVRVIALVDTYGHRIKAVDIDRHDVGERKAVEVLIADLGSQDLVLLDRGFPSGEIFWTFLRRRANFSCRIPSSWKPKLVKQLAPGDYIVKVAATVPHPPSKPGGKPRKRTVNLILRMLEYTCNNKKVRLITNLLQPSVPAIDLAALYHERWEIELVNDEVKNHLATPFHGRSQLCIRSKNPDGVRQELYGMFTAYNFVREVIATAAESHNLKPLEISFVDALNAIRLAIPRLVVAQPAERDQVMKGLLQDIATGCRLRRRRRHRQYPRKVKIKMSSFGCKTARDVQRKVDFAGQLRMLGEPASQQDDAA